MKKQTKVKEYTDKEMDAIIKDSTQVSRRLYAALYSKIPKEYRDALWFCYRLGMRFGVENSDYAERKSMILKGKKVLKAVKK